MADEVDELLETIKEKQYTNLVFDFDETLTILNVPWREWLESVMAALPQNKRAEIKKILNGRQAPWDAVVNEHIKFDDDFYKQFLKICLDFETKYFNHTPYHTLVKSLPDLKAAGRSLYLWTNNMRLTAERGLLELGIAQLFTKIVSREDVRLGKPDPEGWALIKQDTEPLSSYLFIGDSDNDKQAAAHAGIDYFRIRYFKNSA